jgi:hypothetical protein
MIKTISPERLARNERMRIAAENGAVAMADVRARHASVRTNMEKLRELRLAKEASDAAEAEALGLPPARATRKKAAKKAIRVPA